MWTAIGIIGVLGFLVAIVGTIIMAIKRNPLKKWVAAIGICFVMFVMGVSNSTPSSNNSSQTTSTSAGNTVSVEAQKEPVQQTPKSNAIKQGQYKVGSDIPAGDYVLIANGGSAYFQISTDSSGTLDSIIANDNFTSRSIVSVGEGQYFEFRGCSAYPYAQAPAVQPKDNVLEAGMYKVGTDIPAGEYKVESTGSSGYLEVSSNSSHSLNAIVANDNFQGSKYITVKDGQYLKLSYAKLYVNK